ncbi:MAG: hypothetical protein A2901_03115 [Elusimicrobia bacterium RIFCSPLOWO2_01_FULL_54_10]|nr:MAG: hypothetical protein A2901_03115 [Elusimicrobia bacterium RIFCSPLOWO2_01_FULL_54_10]
MITKKAGIVSLLILATALAAQRGFAKTASGENISNMVIEGENRLRVHPIVPPTPWSPNPFRETLDILKEHSVASAFNAPALARPPVVFPAKTMSGKPASPWLNRIFDSPVITLRLKTPQDDRKVDSTFLVKDSAGKTFYEKKTSGKMPSEMAWDGFADSGEPLRVGFDYTHSYLIVDEAGNPHRFAGKSFRLDAFRFKAGGNTVIALNPDTLFLDRSSFKLSRDGADYLTEIKDYVRSGYGRELEIKTYHDDQKFALARSNAMREFLLRVLELPENKISSAGLPLAAGQYRHAEVILK